MRPTHLLIPLLLILLVSCGSPDAAGGKDAAPSATGPIGEPDADGKPTIAEDVCEQLDDVVPDELDLTLASSTVQPDADYNTALCSWSNTVTKNFLELELGTFRDAELMSGQFEVLCATMSTGSAESGSCGGTNPGGGNVAAFAARKDVGARTALSAVLTVPGDDEAAAQRMVDSFAAGIIESLKS